MTITTIPGAPSDAAAIAVAALDDRTRGQLTAHHRAARRFGLRHRCTCGLRWGRCPDAAEVLAVVRRRMPAGGHAPGGEGTARRRGRYWSRRGSRNG